MESNRTPRGRARGRRGASDSSQLPPTAALRESGTGQEQAPEAVQEELVEKEEETEEEVPKEASQSLQTVTGQESTSDVPVGHPAGGEPHTHAVPKAATKGRARGRAKPTPPVSAQPSLQASQAEHVRPTEPKAAQPTSLVTTEPSEGQPSPTIVTESGASQHRPTNITEPRVPQPDLIRTTEPRASQPIPVSTTETRASQPIPVRTSEPRPSQPIPESTMETRASQPIPVSTSEPRPSQSTPLSTTEQSAPRPDLIKTTEQSVAGERSSRGRSRRGATRSSVPSQPDPRTPDSTAPRGRVDAADRPGRGRPQTEPSDQPRPTKVEPQATQPEALPSSPKDAAVADPGAEAEERMVTKPETIDNKQGSSGTSVTLMANYFKLDKKTDWALIQYRVDFYPEEDRTPVRKTLLRGHKDLLGGYLFDGTVLFTSIPLEPEPLEVYSDSPQIPGLKIKIVIRMVGILAVGDYHYLQFFNIIMRKCLAALDLQLVGRHYFDPAASVTLAEHRLELWPGYVTSIRQHEEDVLLCAEVSHKVVRRETALDLLIESRRWSRDSDLHWKERFTATAVGMIILTSYNNKTYRVDDVDYNCTPLSSFEMKTGQQMTYFHYYLTKYNKTITDINQPLLVSRPKPRDVRAGMSDAIYLVPELCQLTGLSEEMRWELSYLEL